MRWKDVQKLTYGRVEEEDTYAICPILQQ